MGDEALRALMPPYRLYRDFLDEPHWANLLAWALRNEAKFEPTKIAQGSDGTQDSSRRMSLGVSDFGPMKTVLRRRMFDLVPTLVKDLRVTPFEPSEVALEMVAHNDGAFFKRHVDTQMGDARTARDLVLSAVLYFYSEPRAFSGGELRLYAFGAEQAEDKLDNFTDLPPEQNILLAFPSWASHEVLPVSCPTKLFSDSRFTVNFVVYRDSKRI